VDPGFEKQNVLALQVFLSRNYQKPDQLTGFFDQALEKIRNVPGVQSAAVVSSPPFINTGAGCSVHLSMAGQLRLREANRALFIPKSQLIISTR